MNAVSERQAVTPAIRRASLCRYHLSALRGRGVGSVPLSSALALRLVVVRTRAGRSLVETLDEADVRVLLPAVFLRFVALFWGSLSLPDVREPERVRG